MTPQPPEADEALSRNLYDQIAYILLTGGARSSLTAEAVRLGTD